MSDKYWPQYELDLQLLAGACESGSELYLTGNFGGFGGSFQSVHRTFEDAKAEIIKNKRESEIYKLELPKAIALVDNNGKVFSHE